MYNQECCNSSFEETDYVDVHGRRIRVVNTDTGEILIPLNEIRKTGFGIYKESQYSKLIVSDKQFNEEFNLYMLEAAKTYMLNNKINFQPDEVFASIENCKMLLTKKKESPPKNNLLGNRSVQTSNDNSLQIRIPNTNSNSPKTPSRINRHPRTISTTSTLSDKTEQPLQRPQHNLNSHPGNRENDLKSPTNFVTSESPIQKNNTFDNGNIRSRINGGNTPVRNQSNQKNDGNSVKIQYVEINGKECEVVISCIDKPNCIWVRNSASGDLLDEIDSKGYHEAPSQENIGKPHLKLNTVYMTLDESQWLRCKIIRFTPLVVQLIDYGNIIEPDKLKVVSPELANYPALAHRITFRNNACTPQLEETLRIIYKNNFEDGTYYVEINNTAVPQEFFRVPAPLCNIANGQRVLIISEDNGIFYVRNRECMELLQKINKIIEGTKMVPLLKVSPKQLVLCKKSANSQYERGLVLSQEDSLVEVHLLDHHEVLLIDLKMLSNITEKLTQEPTTYFKSPKLEGYGGYEPSNDSIEFIRQNIEKRTKYTVHLSSDGAFNLENNGVLISDQLKKLGKCAIENTSFDDRVMLNEIEMHKPTIGMNAYMCGAYRNIDDLVIFPSNEMQQHIDFLMKKEIGSSKPYHPIEGEVCVGLYSGWWSRCAVSRKLNKDYEVVFFDFGNIEILKAEDLRKPDANIKNLPALGIQCRLVDYPKVREVSNALTKYVTEGEMYKVEVKRLFDGKYDILIPSVYENISENAF